MSTIVVGSIKGSPGATTAALALAATWPSDRPVVVAECDRSGGDIAARFDLPSEPGLVSLSAAARHAERSAQVTEHTTKLPGGLPVLLAPPSGAQTRAALSMLRSASFLDVLDHDVIVDAGRLPLDDVQDAAMLRAAALVIIVSRTTVADLHHLAEGVARIQDTNPAVAALLVHTGRYGRDDVEHAMGIDVVGTLPHDPVGAAALGGIPIRARGFGRLALIRSARSVAESIADRLGLTGTVGEDSVAESVA